MLSGSPDLRSQRCKDSVKYSNNLFVWSVVSSLKWFAGNWGFSGTEAEGAFRRFSSADENTTMWRLDVWSWRVVNGYAGRRLDRWKAVTGERLLKVFKGGNVSASNPHSQDAVWNIKTTERKNLQILFELFSRWAQSKGLILKFKWIKVTSRFVYSVSISHLRILNCWKKVLFHSDWSGALVAGQWEVVVVIVTPHDELDVVRQVWTERWPKNQWKWSVCVFGRFSV